MGCGLKYRPKLDMRNWLLDTPFISILWPSSKYRWNIESPYNREITDAGRQHRSSLPTMSPIRGSSAFAQKCIYYWLILNKNSIQAQVEMFIIQEYCIDLQYKKVVETRFYKVVSGLMLGIAKWCRYTPSVASVASHEHSPTRNILIQLTTLRVVANDSHFSGMINMEIWVWWNFLRSSVMKKSADHPLSLERDYDNSPGMMFRQIVSSQLASKCLSFYILVDCQRLAQSAYLRESWFKLLRTY